ncbi:MAG TPA: hypothetical protein VGM41_08540 [Chitinophagaceae bacterium]|jgi:hypothetical protein
MKYSKWLGLLAAAVIIAICYTPWVYIPSVKLEIGGMYATGPQNFGRPGLMNCILSVGAAIMFLLPFVWAKRTNLFIVACNIAWSARNYLLLSRCYAGDCPELKTGLYVLLAASLLMTVAAFMPDVKVVDK